MTLSTNPTTINGQTFTVGQVAHNSVGRLGYDVIVDGFMVDDDLSLIGVMVHTIDSLCTRYMASPLKLAYKPA